MDRRCVIITGGSFSPLTNIKNTDFIIACDKGYEYAQQAGLRPDLLVGDFDSYAGSIDSTLTTQRYQPEKDDTDTMIALRYAVAHGYRDIVLFCALGGRLDHLYGNLQGAAFAVTHGCRVEINDQNTHFYFLQNGTIRLPRRDGFSLSVFSFTDQCEDVSIRGAKYPLEHATLTNTFPLGVSNEWVDEVEISVGNGILMVVLSNQRTSN